MSEKEKLSIASETEQDEKPKLDDAWFNEADAYVGTRLVRRGRPPAENPKVAVSLRLDRDVVDRFKREAPDGRFA